MLQAMHAFGDRSMVVPPSARSCLALNFLPWVFDRRLTSILLSTHPQILPFDENTKVSPKGQTKRNISEI